MFLWGVFVEKELVSRALFKIKEIYPKLSKTDLVIVVGSRANGLAIEDSDIDILIFTKNYNYFKEISVKNGYRQKNEDAGFEVWLDKIPLEVKVKKLEVPKFNSMQYYYIFEAQALLNVSSFKSFQAKVKKEFSKKYEDFLFKNYIYFFNEFKQMQGMVYRKRKVMGRDLEMKKGVVMQALFRLALVIEGKPYCSDKWLYHFASKTRMGKKIDYFLDKIDSVQNYEDWIALKKELSEYVNSNMPKRPYIGVWYKYLNKFWSLELT